MRSEGAILYDFRKAMQDAETLENAAEKMKRLAENDMENSKHSLSAAWTGQASEGYQRKYVKLQRDILSSANDLRRQASTIRTMARRTYEAEMRALRLASDRNYEGH